MLISPTAVASVMKLPDRIAFSIFGFDVYWLGLLLAIGVVTAILLTYFECRRRSLPADTAVDLCLIALPAGVIGARIVYVLFHLSAFKGRALSALYLWDGGLSAAGGIVFALLGILIYALKKRIRFLELMDAITPGVNAALAIGVWGCFFEQCFYGPAVTNAALKWFPLSVRLDGGGIHLALFFYLFVWLVLLFAYLWCFLRKRARHAGDITWVFLMLFGLAYAVLHAFRRDGGEGYRVEQIAGSALFFLCLLFLLIRSVREARRDRANARAAEADEIDAEEAAANEDETPEDAPDDTPDETERAKDLT